MPQPPTKMSTRNLPVGKGRPEHNADNLRADCLENGGASTSHNLRGIPFFTFLNIVSRAVVAQSV
jgi:hypothetical protein